MQFVTCLYTSEMRKGVLAHEQEKEGEVEHQDSSRPSRQG